MTFSIEKYSRIWGDDPKSLLSQYSYQPSATNKLDQLDIDDFDLSALHEIVLWKLNRFPSITEETINLLKSSLKDLKPKEHRQAENAIRALLNCHGIALPMASTILRFLKPDVFQIIDDRVFRVIAKDSKKYPTKGQVITEGYLKNSIAIYFQYLDRLHEISCDELPFRDSDRILYQLDIALGNKIGD